MALTNYLITLDADPANTYVDGVTGDVTLKDSSMQPLATIKGYCLAETGSGAIDYRAAESGDLWDALCDVYEGLKNAIRRRNGK